MIPEKETKQEVLISISRLRIVAKGSQEKIFEPKIVMGWGPLNTVLTRKTTEKLVINVPENPLIGIDCALLKKVALFPD